jgi:HD superfamily phosphodiesterase
MSLEIEKFLIRAYNALEDPAHDMTHARKVLANAHQIVTNERIDLLPDEIVIFDYVMLAHDILDHKAVARGKGLSYRKIHEFTVQQFGALLAFFIEYIHNNCSWSKRKQSVPIPGNPYVRDILRQILQCADWMEAIGVEGIERCRQYSRLVNPTYTDQQIEQCIRDHINENLIHIRDELMIDAARQLVDTLNLHQPLVDYVD